jgi:hypothetical protein
MCFKLTMFQVKFGPQQRGLHYCGAAVAKTQYTFAAMSKWEVSLILNIEAQLFSLAARS